jgi:sugar lactone lactonase YvrE
LAFYKYCYLCDSYHYGDIESDETCDNRSCHADPIPHCIICIAAGLYELDPNGVKPPRPIIVRLADLNAFDFGPDGKLYAPIMSDGKVVTIDVDSDSMRTVADGFKVPVAVKFDAQGCLFVLDSSQGKVFMIDQTEGRKAEYAAIESVLDNLAFDSHGRMFISNTYTGAI